MKRLVALAVAVILTAAIPASAFGHTPAAGAVRKYASDYALLSYKFGGSYPSFVQTAYNTALPTGWVSNNNSRSPRFAYSGTGSGTVYYATSTGVSDCDALAWLGCSNNWGLTSWHIWMKNGASWPVWCETNNVTGCYLAKRVILHEAEHVTLAIANHDPQDGTVSNMAGGPSATNTPCYKAKPGWDSTTPQECDQAALQMRYAMQDLTGNWSSCLDHVAGGGSGGLVTVHSLSQATGTTCAGSSITISGRLATKSDSNYVNLSNINVASKTMYVDRKLHSSSTWTVDWAIVLTTSAASGNNWTRSFTENPGSTLAYDYRIHFKGLSGSLAASYSSTITLTFLKPCPPP